MREYLIVEVLDGVYFANFKDKNSLVYTVDQNEAWKTADFKAAKKMVICLNRLYNIQSKIKPLDFL
ncbi:hypothetical protein [Neobacillus sp. D3-1R]|uniref:hypothetical protein n=1 Tax=Neobacillus sp. D3-1R TaxID=3445778 RepID=UPI003FA0F802